MNKEYREIVAAFQVGTRRVAPPATSLIPAIPDVGRERQLLLQAGIGALMMDAGAKPATDYIALESAPLEDRTIANAAEEPIREAFDLGFQRAVREWAQAAGRKGWVAPPRSLPALIELARKEPYAIVPVLGARGQWLAEVIGAGIPSIEPSERETQRAKDPQTYREILNSELANLGFEDRLEAVSALKANLSTEDEPVLEQALGDRRKEIRTLAAHMLAKLPGSRLSQEVIQLANQSIKHEKSLLKERLSVELPELESLPKWFPQPTALGNQGPKAVGLMEILTLIPPGHWEARFKTPPQKFLNLAAKTEFPEALVHGVAKAAANFRNWNWTGEAFRFLLGQEPIPTTVLKEIVPLVSESMFDEAIIGDLAPGKPWSQGTLFSLYSRQRPYSPRLTRAVVEHFHPGIWRDAVMDILYLLDPASATGLKLEFPESQFLSKQNFDRLGKLVPLRLRLLSSLNPYE
jgi:Family of unknown function (DUF5691)